MEEVKELMDKALDDAILSNTPYIRVMGLVQVRLEKLYMII